MSRWVFCGLMLVSLLLSLATPPAQAQTINIGNLFPPGGDIKTPTPIIVLDFENSSTYKTGMLGRTISDALSIELLNTRTFEVIKRSKVEKVMTDLNLTLPLDVQAQAMVADRLQSAFVVSGNIEDVQIRRVRTGTYAEVTIRTIVLHRVTRIPINGAYVTTRSSPKIGYSGNTDVLVHEALQIAAYQLTQKILENRLPIATVLNTPIEGEAVLRGGSTIGFHKGMVLTTVRRDTVTGRIRLTWVGPSDSRGEVMEDSKGIAPGDKAVPIFEFIDDSRFKGQERKAAGLQIAGYALLGWIAVMVGTENGNKGMRNNPPTPVVAAMADAYTMDQVKGANLLRWPEGGSRVVAYIIYRDTNPFAPIAVVDGFTNYYVDSSMPFPNLDDVMEDTTVSIELEAESGEITSFDFDTTYAQDTEEMKNPEMQNSEDSFEITCHRVPLKEGESCGYQIRILYMDYTIGDLGEAALQHPEEYRLFLGNRGSVSQRVTLTYPADLIAPNEEELPYDGMFRCTRVSKAMSYTLQLSTDPTFTPGNTRTIPGRIESEAYAVAEFAFTQLWQTFPANGAQTIYWRMGAKVAGQPTPTALSDTNQNGWVYTATRFFQLPETPPPGRRGAMGVLGPPAKGVLSGRQDRQRSHIFRR